MTAGYTRGELFTSSDSSWRPSHHQNSAAGAVYVFGDGKTVVESPEHANESIELPAMRSRHWESPWQTNHAVEKLSDVLYYDRAISPGDTLQGLALQYGCTVRRWRNLGGITVGVVRSWWFPLVSVCVTVCLSVCLAGWLAYIFIDV